MTKKSIYFLGVMIFALLLCMLTIHGYEVKETVLSNENCEISKSEIESSRTDNGGYNLVYGKNQKNNRVNADASDGDKSDSNFKNKGGDVSEIYQKTSSKKNVPAITNTITTSKKPEEVNLSDSEMKSLKYFLIEFVYNYWTSSSFGVGNNDKNYSSTDPELILSRMLFSGNYKLIKGEERIYNEGTYNGAPASIADAEEVDKVLKDYFNCSEESIAEMRRAGEENFRNHNNSFYGFDAIVYEDGYYYSIVSGVGNMVNVSIDIKKIEYEEGKYYVYYTCENSELGVFLSSYDYVAVMDMKQTDENLHWSMYSNSEMLQ